MDKHKMKSILKNHVEKNKVELKRLAKEARSVIELNTKIDNFIYETKKEILENGIFMSTIQYKEEYGIDIIKDPEHEIFISMADLDRYSLELLEIYKTTPLMIDNFELDTIDKRCIWAIQSESINYIKIEIEIVKLFRSFQNSKYEFDATLHNEEIKIIYNIIDNYL